MTTEEHKELIELAKSMENILMEFSDSLHKYGAPVRLREDLLDLSEDSHKLMIDLERTAECSAT